MLGQIIRLKIDENNKTIEKLIKPNQFVLNKEISKLLEENKKLQEQCAHTYENGKCIYCDKEKKE